MEVPERYILKSRLSAQPFCQDEQANACFQLRTSLIPDLEILLKMCSPQCRRKFPAVDILKTQRLVTRNGIGKLQGLSRQLNNHTLTEEGEHPIRAGRVRDIKWAPIEIDVEDVITWLKASFPGIDSALSKPKRRRGRPIDQELYEWEDAVRKLKGKDYLEITKTLDKEPKFKNFRKDPSKFKARVIGTLKAVLPRNRPGKRASPLVGLAAEIYQHDFKEQGKEANWHSISTRVVPGYQDLPSDTQKLCCIQLRANVHTYPYEYRSRERRKKRMLSMASHVVAQEGEKTY